MVLVLDAGLWIIRVTFSTISFPIPGSWFLHICQCMLWESAIQEMSWNVPGWVTVSSTALCLHVMQGTLVSMFLHHLILCLLQIQQQSGFRTFTSTTTRLSRTMDRLRRTAIA